MGQADNFWSLWWTDDRVAPRAGLEPATCGLTDEPPVDLFNIFKGLASKAGSV